jgi:hypothetical protein
MRTSPCPVASANAAKSQERSETKMWLKRTWLLAMALLMSSTVGCRSSLDTCLDFCAKANECIGKGCSCSIDRCDNEGDVADAMDACLDLPCAEYLKCVNKAVATCEL